MDAHQALAILVDRLIHSMNPREIILFGSHATGRAGPDSDIDLMVVLDRVEDPFEDMIRALKSVSDLAYPKDILVTDPERLQRRAAMPHTIEHAVMTEGRRLYAA